YEAISYTWGDQGRTQPLICDGTTINITPNLASALLCLRSQTRPRRLWADAVCINQNDRKEKEQQIPLMATIFRSATQVRVWLGSGDEGESQALADLAAFARVTGLTRPSAYQDHYSETQQALVDMGRSADKVFRMPWFGRRWIVQELVLNWNVMFHCGQSKISWPAMHFAFNSLPTSIWDDVLDIQIRRKLRQFGNLWRTRCFASDSKIDCGIYSLLHSFHDLECQVPKDRLYAIAGLADD
ncbi:heterokaryon incompatibility protein-domain-containing protein, partial [Diaporthe sp. PMI_573]